MGREHSQGEQRQPNGQEPPADGGGPGGADRAHRRESELPVDQDPVEQDVGQVGEHNHDDDRTQPAERLQALAEHDEEKERQNARREAHAVGGGQRHHVRGLAEQRENRGSGCEQDRARDRQKKREDDAPLYATRHRGRVTRPEGLGHDRIEHHQRAHAEHGRHEEVEVAQGHRREPLGRDMADHDGVDHAHAHDADLDEDDRQRQVQHGA